jgi:hypothetical protein
MRLAVGLSGVVRLAASALLVGFLVVTVGSASADAESGTPAGNAACPHGFNAYTWASDMCYWGEVTYQVAGYLVNYPPVGLPGGNNTGAFVRDKVSLYGGSPCKYYLEGGLEYYGAGNGTEDVSDYYAWSDTQGLTGQYITNTESTAPISDTVYWYQGTSEFGLNVGDPFNPSHPDAVDPYIGYGGCFNEAGGFLASTSTNLSSISLDTAYIESLAVYFPTNPVTSKNSFSSGYAVIDNPCGSSPCMNGVYYAEGTEWAYNRG